MFVENRDYNLAEFYYFLFKPDNLTYLLKNVGGYIMGGCVSFGFFSTSKKRNKW